MNRDNSPASEPLSVGLREMDPDRKKAAQLSRKQLCGEKSRPGGIG